MGRRNEINGRRRKNAERVSMTMGGCFTLDEHLRVQKNGEKAESTKCRRGRESKERHVTKAAPSGAGKSAVEVGSHPSGNRKHRQLCQTQY